MMLRSMKQLVIVIIILMIPRVTLADSPGGAFFSYQCNTGRIDFSRQGSFVLSASFNQVASALARAISSQQNQQITNNGEVSLWALRSNELQIHENKDPDLTKWIVPATICGTLTSDAPTPPQANTTPGFTGQALALVILNGPGQAIAYAWVDSSGHVVAYASVVGDGQAVAIAQTSTTNQTERAHHVVQAGENLFRIALRYGTTVQVLAQINGITDPTRIYVGQVIYLP